MTLQFVTFFFLHENNRFIFKSKLNAQTRENVIPPQENSSTIFTSRIFLQEKATDGVSFPGITFRFFSERNNHFKISEMRCR